MMEATCRLSEIAAATEDKAKEPTEHIFKWQDSNCQLCKHNYEPKEGIEDKAYEIIENLKQYEEVVQKVVDHYSQSFLNLDELTQEEKETMEAAARIYMKHIQQKTEGEDGLSLH